VKKRYKTDIKAEKQLIFASQRYIVELVKSTHNSQY